VTDFKGYTASLLPYQRIVWMPRSM